MTKEARNPKSEVADASASEMIEGARLRRRLQISSLSILDLFRISDFGFRISFVIRVSSFVI